ncbi:MAG TPA: GNAT family N-acetyltransferase [Beijerinckiaceae bacterium]|jgi:GNAT superfamily N-acetyltransferase
MTLLVRPAAPADAALVLALIRELAEYERLADEVDATEAMIAAALFGDHPRAFCDIAEWEGEAAGLALWFYSFSTFRGRHGIYLEDLFVRPAHRGRGIGRALFTNLARRCATENLPRLEWAVLDWNEPALGFYRRLGAEALDGWTVHRLSGAALDALAAGP